MKVHVEEISPVQKKVSIEIPADMVDAEIENFYAGVQKKNKLQGFRLGKAPIQLVKRTFSDSMPNKVMRRIYEQTLYTILGEQKIEPADYPIIEGEKLAQGVPFKYSALIEIMPEIHLNEYTGLAVKKEKNAASPGSVEQEIKRMQENMAQLIPLDNGVKIENGNVVSIDYTFSVDGFPEESINAEDAEVDVGANKYIPGFEEQLIGMKCGESREIRVTLPEGYRYSKVDGKKGIFHVILKRVKRKELPKLDDEFARQCGKYESMQQLRAELIEHHEKQEADRIESELKDRVIQALIEKNPVDVPEALVKRQLDHMLEIFEKSQQMSIETMHFDKEGFRQHFHDAAADRVKGRLLLKALADKETISVEDAELEMRYEKITANNPDMLDRIKEDYESNPSAKNALIAEIKENKAINFLLNHAVITEVAASELKPV